MSPLEHVQANSLVARRAVDSVLVSMVVGIPVLIAAGAMGLFG